MPVAVRLKNDAPVDDIQIDLHGGGRVFVQVKVGLSVTISDPTFIAVLGQFSAAIKDLHLDAGRDRLVLAVTRKTKPLDSLFLAWRRSKTSLSGRVASASAVDWQTGELHAHTRRSRGGACWPLMSTMGKTRELPVPTGRSRRFSRLPARGL